MCSSPASDVKPALSPQSDVKPVVECQICFESFPEMYKVTCGSTVDHLICFDCETQWRAKMPIRAGVRTMTCPTCRQPEKERTVCSLSRELDSLTSRPQTQEEWRSMFVTTPSPGLTRVFCASGRPCLARSRGYGTRSRVSSRVKTYLKCRSCRVVACCVRCGVCTGCSPL